MNTVSLAKLAIKASPTVPSFSRASIGELEEVFNTELFVNGSEIDQREIMLGSSTSKYRGELEYPWDNYFGYDLAPFLQNKSALDLGCHTGGRSVAWFERYKLFHITGIDVRDEFIAAAKQFASVHQASADFTLGVGERLPFEDESFDAILSFDVLEHVQNIESTMSECRRVLKPGGAFYLVFPGFYQPWEHHLTLATRTPCLHWFFGGKTLVKAYYEVLAQRSDSDWYRRKSPELKPWERGHTINGTTVRQFKRLIEEGDWRVVSESRLPIGAIGRNASTHRAAGVARTVAKVLSPFTNVPGAQELVRHRITYVLQKPF
ncbi:class I SAM-dependent methyltransferase [Mycolicibacterium sp. D5.8-2]|uniref:class I SAM-dependent methyltransferase n=1 Tax=Mycolicibacterium sp. D5.8-2 TaxID=3085903 RepID=UPI00298C5975|nr:class I SAM-dependent methyltransferase [Mycolicibacterium sp. D5.8-2]MDW5615075.1 class I SAM-dependent methyltransferase [Mycolicibacterium sp. D5.8-2]